MASVLPAAVAPSLLAESVEHFAQVEPGLMVKPTVQAAVVAALTVLVVFGLATAPFAAPEAVGGAVAATVRSAEPVGSVVV